MTRTRASSGDIGSPVESDTLSSEQPVMAARMTAERAVRRSMFFISRVFRDVLAVFGSALGLRPRR